MLQLKRKYFWLETDMNFAEMGHLGLITQSLKCLLTITAAIHYVLNILIILLPQIQIRWFPVQEPDNSKTMTHIKIPLVLKK